MNYLHFPINNNKDLIWPIPPENEQMFPTVDPSSWFELRCYDSENSELYSSNWGDPSDPLTDAIWIGKDVDRVEFACYNDQSVKHQLASLAFENGRKNFQNIFACQYEISNDDSHVIVDNSEVEFTELFHLPFGINTSVRIPEGVSEFPGITLEAPIGLPASTDSWTCRVVLPKTVTTFEITVGSTGSYPNDKNLIQVTPSSDPEEFFSLTSEKGTVEIYLLDHKTLPEIQFPDSHGRDFNLKFFFNEETFNQLLQDFPDEETANAYGYYKLKIKDVSGFETKVAEALGTSSLDIKVDPLENTDITEIINTPSLGILDCQKDYDDELSQSFITGTLVVRANNLAQNKYIDFKRYDTGTMTAEYYTLIDSIKVGVEDVSSKLRITVASASDSGNDEITFSFNGASLILAFNGNGGAIVK